MTNQPATNATRAIAAAKHVADIGPRLNTAPRPQRAAPITRIHTGPIHSSVAGRTDHLNMHVHSGSYVIPADIVSSMGEGNTLAGFQHVKRMFSGAPYGASGSPYGAKGGPYGAALPKAAGGPAGPAEAPPVPIVAAGGEYVLAPHEVQFAGDGDMDAGHHALDTWVNAMRAKTVKTLRRLPGPKKD